MDNKIDRNVREFMLPDMDSTFRVFAAHWRTVEAGWKYPAHKHPLFEVNLVLSGTQEMIVNRKTILQEPGDLLLLAPGEEHESRVPCGEDMTYYCLHFDVDERSLRELLCRHPSSFHAAGSELAKAIRPALDKLIALTTEGSAIGIASRMSVLSALFELFAGISGTLSVTAGEHTVSGRTQAASQVAAMIEQAVKETAAGFREESELEKISEIAMEIGYSMSSVNRMFGRVYGLSPRQYLSSLMLKKSKLLLMDPELTIEEVSARLGYGSTAHFSRQFKRWTGEPPSKFRARFL